ncbi:universal stress protein [Algibacter amylolyticus]|uniref:Universal stress protein n=1 Tax=Algibacter amylolyticus TaxID=1608400 RepID=A0A5M7B9H5_9FLAO|nr:universal stress protein [Algibacter amylolyticus]KAA5826243.1 universal stress protein [Algibacter amylolyticus]MBB5268445.1 nucleotide-binding universal stress UspA family protein [Algibacter amylolyticus]TSJ80281.1 universal stress protein [Algibacter amylolyticus]
MLSILIPTDFSENSKNAINYALEFFKYQKTEFYFMHAYQNEFYDHEELASRDVFNDILTRVRNESQSNLEQLITEVKKTAPNPRFTYHCISAYNTLIEEANLIANAKNIDLIVMGTKGISDERHIVFGSQTFQVLKYVPCPVLAIPSNYTNTRPKRILFPTNFLMPYKRRELKLLSILAKPNRSCIDVLYVSKINKLSIRQEDNKAFIKDALSENEVKFHHEDSIKIADTIKTFIEEKDFDMITMVNTQHSFLEDMLFPSNIDKVSLGLTIPLLAMQNTARV